MRTNSITAPLVSLGLFAAAAAATTAISIEPLAAMEAEPGVPCAGVWMINEQATMRATTAMGPSVQFFESWGPNGWMRMNTGELESATRAEFHFEQFNGQTYQVFGTDPSLGKARKITDRIIEASRVREGRDANSQYVFFSQDCSRVTMYKAEGEDRHAPPGQSHYYNDLRVYDIIEPPAVSSIAGEEAAAEFFGGWVLNRAASRLTLEPKVAETIIIVPWGKSGWVWNQLSGGPYQPEGLHEGVERVECGASQGATAISCQGPPASMMLYWASWDSKAFPTYGTQHGQVQVKMIDNRSFEITSFQVSRDPASGNKASVVLSPDGDHMTVTTRSGAANGANQFEDDLRVYDRIDGRTWPSVTR